MKVFFFFCHMSMVSWLRALHHVIPTLGPRLREHDPLSAKFTIGLVEGERDDDSALALEVPSQMCLNFITQRK